MAQWKEIEKKGKVVEAGVRVGVFKLSIHHYMGYGKQWFATCNIFDRVRLESTELSEAKCQAKALLQVKLQRAIDEIAEL